MWLDLTECIIVINEWTNVVAYSEFEHHYKMADTHYSALYSGKGAVSNTALASIQIKLTTQTQSMLGNQKNELLLTFWHFYTTEFMFVQTGTVEKDSTTIIS